MFSKRVKSYALTCNENELRKGKNAKSGRGLQGVLRIRKKNEMKIEPIRFDSICHWTNTFSVQFGSMLVVFLLLRKKLTLQQIMLINCWFPLSILKRKKKKAKGSMINEMRASVFVHLIHLYPIPMYAHARTWYPVSLCSTVSTFATSTNSGHWMARAAKEWTARWLWSAHDLLHFFYAHSVAFVPEPNKSWNSESN